MSSTAEQTSHHEDEDFIFDLEPDYSDAEGEYRSAHYDIDDYDDFYLDGFDAEPSDIEADDDHEEDSFDSLDYFKLSSEAEAAIEELRSEFDSVRSGLAYTMIQEGRLSRYIHRATDKIRGLSSYETMRQKHDDLMQQVYDIIDDDFDGYDEIQDELDDSDEAHEARDKELLDHFQLFMALERKQIDQEKIAILSEGRLGKFLQTYDKLGKLGKFGAGVALGAGVAVGASTLGVGAAVGGAAGLAVRFGRGYVNNAKRINGHSSDEVYEEFSAKDRDYYDDERRVEEILSAELYGDLQADIKRDIRANTWTLAKTVGTIAIGSAVGELARNLYMDKWGHQGSKPEFIGNRDLPDSERSLYEPIPIQDLIEARDEVAGTVTTGAEGSAVPAEIAPSLFDSFSYTPQSGEGITYALKDLAATDSHLEGLGNKLSPKDLYDVYEQFEGRLAGLPNTYDMGNGDFGIASSGEAYTIPADLRADLVEAMRQKVGLGPLEQINLQDVADVSAVENTQEATSNLPIEVPAEAVEPTIEDASQVDVPIASTDDTTIYRPGAGIADTGVDGAVEAPDYDAIDTSDFDPTDYNLTHETPSGFANYLAEDSFLTKTEISVESARRLSEELGENVVFRQNLRGGDFRIDGALLNTTNQMKLKEQMLALVQENS